MPSGPGERYDFFLSRHGSVAAIAREVTTPSLRKATASANRTLAPAKTPD
jgi:hypothetical protein